MFTNSGTDRNSYCYEEHQHAVRVAAGTRTPDEAFTYVGEVIDDDDLRLRLRAGSGDDPLNDPSCWAKPNPLLGTILTEEYLAGVVKQAKDDARASSTASCGCTSASGPTPTRPGSAASSLEKVLVDFDPAQHHGKEVSLGARPLGHAATSPRIATSSRPARSSGAREDGSRSGRAADLRRLDRGLDAGGHPGGSGRWPTARPTTSGSKQGFLRTTPGPQIRLRHRRGLLRRLRRRLRHPALAYDRYAYDKLPRGARRPRR
jgi:hypothetical protein